MASRSAPSLIPAPKRKFLLAYGVGVLLVLSVFMALSMWIDTRTRQRQEAIFNEQQSLQTRLAQRALGDHFETIRQAAQAVIDHSLPEYLKSNRNEQALISLYRSAASRIGSLEAIAFLETPVYFATHSSDYSRRGVYNQMLGLEWSREYWDHAIRGEREAFVPPIHADPQTQAMGMMIPVRDKGELLGVFTMVVNLGPAIERYIFPMRSGDAGAGYLLDDQGVVVFDHERSIIGQNILGTLHDGYPVLQEMDRRMLSEPSGKGSYTFITRRGGPQVRKLLAWDSTTFGNRRLIVALAAPDIEVDTVLEGLRLERLILGGMLLATLLLGGAYLYRRTAAHEIASAQQQILDIIEFLPDPTFAVDNEGRLIAWNRAIADLTGVPGHEMLGKGDREYAIPFYGSRKRGLIDLVGSNPEEIERRYSNVESDGHTLNAETFVPKVHGGKGAHVWATASLLLDSHGRKVGAIESIRDITERIEAGEALRNSEERFSLAIAGANDGIWDWDILTDEVFFSRRYKEIIGYEDHEIENHVDEWKKRIHPDDWDAVMTANMTVIDGEATHFEVEYRLRHKDGSYRWILGRGAGLRDENGLTIRMSGAHTDITDRKYTESVSRILLDISSAVSTTRDLKGLYSRVHDILREHIGAENFYIALIDEERDVIDFVYAQDPYHGLPWEPVPIAELDGASLTLAVYNSETPMRLKKREQIEMRVLGEPTEVWCGVPLRLRNKVTGVMAMADYFDPNRFTDDDLELMTSVSEQVGMAIERRMYEEQIRHQALHDSLTGLPNRVLLMDRLDRAMQRVVRREGYLFAVIMMDLDRFKMVNDSHGHLVGDKLLQEAARRIQPILRSMDTLVRLGGDEFAILLEEFDKPQQVIHITRRIQQAIAEPMNIEGLDIRTTASAGIVIRTDRYASPEEILRDSDIAMYQAKRQGMGLFRVFNTAMHEQAVQAMALESDMAAALAGNQFHLHFQPIFKARSRRLAGFETLLRWDHPVRGSVPPGQFIPLAEETGLIQPLGDWVLDTACATMARWRESHEACRDLFLAVNLSAKQASRTSVVSHVRKVLEDTGLPPENLKLELTETALMHDPNASLDHLVRLKNLGVGLAIDDFGTGYSSLAYLSRFPVDTLKVDHSFVRSLGEQPENLEIIRSVVALAETLGLEVVAEGVENAMQLDAVTGLGCTAVQGFHLARPMPPDQAEALIKAEGDSSSKD